MAKVLQRGEQKSMVSSMNFEVKSFGEMEERVLRFIGSDETPDRDGDVISVNGWDLKNYSKNPVFLWAHDASIPPVGKANSVTTENGKLMFDIEFPEKGIYPLADLVYNLYKGGFLNATSVGFIGTEVERREDDAVKDLPEWKRGVKFNAQELLELSAVPVPSNPSALQQAKSAGKISSDEYSSLMSFIGGEFVVNANTGSKSMSGIKGVYANEEEKNVPTTNEPEVKQPDAKEPEAKEPEKVEPEVKKEPETKEEPETKTAVLATDSLYSFMLNPKANKTLLVDNTTGKVLGDVTEEVKSLLSHAKEAIREEVEAEVKAGAALSKKNKSRLSQAKDLIIEVLGQVESEDSSIEDEKTGPAVLPEEEELTGNEDLSMSGNNKSAGSDDGSNKDSKTPEGDDSFEFELDEEEDEDMIEISEEDVAESVKAAVAELIK